MFKRDAILQTYDHRYGIRDSSVKSPLPNRQILAYLHALRSNHLAELHYSMANYRQLTGQPLPKPEDAVICAANGSVDYPYDYGKAPHLHLFMHAFIGATFAQPNILTAGHSTHAQLEQKFTAMYDWFFETDSGSTLAPIPMPDSQDHLFQEAMLAKAFEARHDGTLKHLRKISANATEVDFFNAVYAEADWELKRLMDDLTIENHTLSKHQKQQLRQELWGTRRPLYYNDAQLEQMEAGYENTARRDGYEAMYLRDTAMGLYLAINKHQQLAAYDCQLPTIEAFEIGAARDAFHIAFALDIGMIRDPDEALHVSSNGTERYDFQSSQLSHLSTAARYEFIIAADKEWQKILADIGLPSPTIGRQRGV